MEEAGDEVKGAGDVEVEAGDVEVEAEGEEARSNGKPRQGRKPCQRHCRRLRLAAPVAVAAAVVVPVTAVGGASPRKAARQECGENGYPPISTPSSALRHSARLRACVGTAGAAESRQRYPCASLGAQRTSSPLAAQQTLGAAV